MNEWVRTAIVDIDLVVHISRKASQGGGDLWIELQRSNIKSALCRLSLVLV